MKRLQKVLFLLIAVILIGSSQSIVEATEFATVNDGTYSVNAKLSCYINAMGGVEFGGPLLKGAEVAIDSGEAVMKLTFGKSTVTIYGITCDTFIDTNPGGSANGQGIIAGTIGYYDKNGNLQTSNITTTLSTDTALNSANEAVPYVTSVSFPLDQISSTYQLTMYINSNVMGTQFGAGSYPATLTMDWSSVPNVEIKDNNLSGSSSSTGNTNAGGSTGTGNSSTSDNAGTAENADTSGITSTAGNVNSGGDVNAVENSGTSAENNASTESGTSTQGTETSETAGTTEESKEKNIEAVEKDGLNIYYANDEKEEVSKNGATGNQDSKADEFVLGVAIMCVAVALGVGSVVLKKKLKKK